MERGLDEEDVAAAGVHASPVETPGLAGAALALLKTFCLPRIVLAPSSALKVSDLRPFSATARANLRAHGADLALQVAHPGLARVALDDHAKSRRRRS